MYKALKEKHGKKVMSRLKIEKIYFILTGK